ncbi:hypothetical protein [Helicobacter brantae]|uniref:Uncharacterized protein n=1 Tax=Helicobacter brantae TaxID=375927 RepID=A0A3D8IU44_9HELI|nr:hypothetical protein [Helicobacter brantae]RDU68752.1 hypothetical protein CQA58_07990 [Helicobacter brantae]
MEEILKLRNNLNKIFAIHYSCASFDENINPHIFSIAIRNIGSGEELDFCVQTYADKSKLNITEKYDELEKELLKDFLLFMKKHNASTFIHWNMRNSKFGFQAIFERLKILQNSHIEIPEFNKIDLAKTLIETYGDLRIPHGKKGRLFELATLNNITTRDFLEGVEEAEAIKCQNYAKARNSTLRKTTCIADIFAKTIHRELEIKKESWVFQKIKKYFPLAILISIATLLDKILNILNKIYSFIKEFF